ncbi:hypothetical protein [Frateuria defendens]|uniref:hypothetical protein n=1 Tax=Frateuria defendens TaxID=2219559 RepID=UPI00129372FE|nr:hypothetical protein [Frateuria defendens]
MKLILPIAVAAVLLAGCSIRKGISDQLPRLSSQSTKSVEAYVQCVQPKWTALTQDVSVSNKDGDARIDAHDGKAKITERLVITNNAGAAQVVLYEVQKKTYDVHYRDEAVSCL